VVLFACTELSTPSWSYLRPSGSYVLASRLDLLSILLLVPVLEYLLVRVPTCTSTWTGTCATGNNDCRLLLRCFIQNRSPVDFFHNIQKSASAHTFELQPPFWFPLRFEPLYLLIEQARSDQTEQPGNYRRTDQRSNSHCFVINFRYNFYFIIFFLILHQFHP